MREVVLDASVFLKWASPLNERLAIEAGRLLDSYADGSLSVVAPPLLFQESLNVAGRTWGWHGEELLAYAALMSELRFEVVQPDPVEISVWVDRGLTAYDATYVALAEAHGIPLITDDAQILAAAPEQAVSLASS